MGNRVFCSDAVCPKSSLHPGVESELFDDSSTCDPAGAVFTETLEELNEIDRFLLLFSSSRNLAGVRWLSLLGANPDACDTNGTTCLHAACRSGSLAVIKEILKQRKLSLDATDASGWSPMHVALFMGRRQVCVLLMQKGCDPLLRTHRGQTPVELVSDVWLREAMQSYTEYRELQLKQPWRPPPSLQPGLRDEVSSRLRFEPFFVPRTPVFKDVASQELQKLARKIFNTRPGQGLAFLVATGCIRDFPVELSMFFSQPGISTEQVGQFLGEDFSLSQTLRLEFVNSLRLLGTGVVSCLAKVFKSFVMPTELLKIDRLVDGIAQIWWRQHEQLAKKEGETAYRGGVGEDGAEVQGLELMHVAGSYDVLHQLMFSTVLLHWNLYAPLPRSQRVTTEQWLQIGSGISPELEDSGDRKSRLSAMTRIQSLIYNVVAHNFYPQLEMWKVRVPTDPAQVASEGQLEVFARLVAGGFPSLALAGAHRVVSYRHIRSIHSESTSMPLPAVPSRAASRTNSRDEGLLLTTSKSAPAFRGLRRALSVDEDTPRGYQESPISVDPGFGSLDKAFLTLHECFLFLSASNYPWAPYACMNVKGLVVAVDSMSLLLTLLPAPVPPITAQVQAETVKSPISFSLPSPTSPPRLSLVFLLPDGRWQVLELPRFQVQLPDTQQLERWRDALAKLCSECITPDMRMDDPLWYGKTKKEIEYATELEKSNGNAASREGDWKKANRYWKNALKGAEKLQDADTEFRLHSNMALGYTKLMKVEKALEHCDK
ncbi:secG, partial [Symbiodinium necroappetens]